MGVSFHYAPKLVNMKNTKMQFYGGGAILTRRLRAVASGWLHRYSGGAAQIPTAPSESPKTQRERRLSGDVFPEIVLRKHAAFAAVANPASGLGSRDNGGFR